MDEDDNHPPAAALPLDGWHRANGARMVEFAGYWMPIQYDREGGGIIAEHNWTRSHAGLFDVSHMGQLMLSGEGLDAALEAVLPIDLATLKQGRQRYSVMLNEDGGVLDDLMVSRWDEGLILVVNGATKWDDIAHLREHLPDAITINHMDDRALLALQGPQAAAVLARHAKGPVSLDSFTFMHAARFEIGGIEAMVSRSGYTGEDGFEISVPAQEAERLAQALCAEDEVRAIGLGARDSLRLEAALPLYGHDLSPETSPIEAGLSFAINKRRRAEGGFLGAERVLRELAEGPKRQWVGIAIEGRMPAREGAAILIDERRVGAVTSGGFSPTLSRPIAMGYVPSDAARVDQPLEIEVRGKRIAARICPTPFVPHRYYRGR